MADRLELGVSADPSQIREVESALTDVGKAATAAGGKLDDAGDVDLTDVLLEISNLKGMVTDLHHALNETADEMQDVESAGRRMGDSVSKAGNEGAKSAGGMSLKIISLNQAIELGKKGAELLGRAIEAAAANGSPAIIELQSAVGELQQSFISLADDPIIQSWATGTTERIRSQLIPTLDVLIENIARGTAAGKAGLLSVGSAFGVVSEEAAAAAAAQIGLNEAERAGAEKAIAAKREQINVDQRYAAIRAKVVADGELQKLAQLDNEAAARSMIEAEIESMRKLERAGEANAKTREESARRLELLERRLVEIPKERADAEKKAADEAQKAAESTYQKQLDEYQKLQDERVKIHLDAEARITEAQRKQAEERIAIAQAEFDAKVRMIEQADGGKLLQNARQALDPRAVAQQVGNQRAAAARDQFTRENAGGLDASDANAVRRFNAQRNAAAAAAGRQGFRDVATGRASEQEIGQAQTSLIQASAQQAQAAGQLGASTAQALIQAANNQQQLAQQQAQQQAQIDAVRQALSGVGTSVSNNRARAQSGGLRR